MTPSTVVYICWRFGGTYCLFSDVNNLLPICTALHPRRQSSYSSPTDHQISLIHSLRHINAVSNKEHMCVWGRLPPWC